MVTFMMSTATPEFHRLPDWANEFNRHLERRFLFCVPGDNGNMSRRLAIDLLAMRLSWKLDRSSPRGRHDEECYGRTGMAKTLDLQLDKELEATFPASDALKITRRQPDIFGNRQATEDKRKPTSKPRFPKFTTSSSPPSITGRQNG